MDGWLILISSPNEGIGSISIAIEDLRDGKRSRLRHGQSIIRDVFK